MEYQSEVGVLLEIAEERHQELELSEGRAEIRKAVAWLLLQFKLLVPSMLDGTGAVPKSTLRVYVMIITGGIIIGPILAGNEWWNGFRLLPFVLVWPGWELFVGSLLLPGVIYRGLMIFFYLWGRTLLFLTDHKFGNQNWRVLRWKIMNYQLAVFLLDGWEQMKTHQVWSGLGDDEKDDGVWGEILFGDRMTAEQKIAEQRLIGWYGLRFFFRSHWHDSYVLDVVPHALGAKWNPPLAPHESNVLNNR